MLKNIYVHLILAICALCSFYSAFGLQRTRTGVRQGASFLRPSRSVRSLSEAYSWQRPTPSSKKVSSRAFVTSPGAYRPQVVAPDTGSFWILKPKSQQMEDLFTAFGQKIKGERTAILSSEAIDDMIERLAEEKYINEHNREGKTPLMIAIENTAGASKEKQKEIIRKLYKHGAFLFDLPALQLAVKTANLGALEIMQPLYRLKDLYPEFKKILAEYATTKKKIIQAQKDQRPYLEKTYKLYLDNLKEELEILSRPVQPLEFRVQVFRDGKEQEEFIQVNTVTGLYKLEKDYSIDPLAQ